MLRATKDIKLPTTITGSLPRPSWYTENLGMRSFLDAMVGTQFRDQYIDAVSIYLHEQEIAGLDIVTDGDAHLDSDVGGQSWTNYPPRHMGGFDRFNPQITPGGRAIAFAPGHILHDYLESRVMPGIVGPVTRGDLQYAAIWKGAQRLTRKPVKFGTIGPELVAFAVEEPQVHLLAARNLVNEVINPQFSVEVFNQTVAGLRAKTEVWCHTCWGNPSQQRMFIQVMSYKPALEMLDKVDADVITFESCSAGGIDLEAFGKMIADKKIAIGVIDHHTLQVERPEEIADHIRRGLKHIPVERLVISSDCGMGREGMSRRHAFYKIVALVQGTNIVRRELGLPVADCLAADPHFSLVPSAAAG